MSTTQTDPVSSAMSARVLGVTPKTPLEVALRLMAETHVHHLPVIDGQRCVGLLHETDVLWSLWTDASAKATAAGSCRAPVPLVTPDDPIGVAAARMTRRGTDAALVTTDDAIVGIITATDILRYVGEGAP